MFIIRQAMQTCRTLPSMGSDLQNTASFTCSFVRVDIQITIQIKIIDLDLYTFKNLMQTNRRFVKFCLHRPACRSQSYRIICLHQGKKAGCLHSLSEVNIIEIGRLRNIFPLELEIAAKSFQIAEK